VPLSLRALVIHSDLHSPDIRVDLHWLRRQRELLGEESFGEILREHLEDGAAAVLDLMEKAGDS